MKPHVHAELIKQWADGAQIQFYGNFISEWADIAHPTWCPTYEYRVKPDVVEDFIAEVKAEYRGKYGSYADIRCMVTLRDVLSKYNITLKDENE